MSSSPAAVRVFDSFMAPDDAAQRMAESICHLAILIVLSTRKYAAVCCWSIGLIVGSLLHQLQGGDACAQKLAHTLAHGPHRITLPLRQ